MRLSRLCFIFCSGEADGQNYKFGSSPRLTSKNHATLIRSNSRDRWYFDGFYEGVPLWRHFPKCGCTYCTVLLFVFWKTLNLKSCFSYYDIRMFVWSKIKKVMSINVCTIRGISLRPFNIQGYVSAHQHEKQMSENALFSP